MIYRVGYKINNVRTLIIFINLIEIEEETEVFPSIVSFSKRPERPELGLAWAGAKTGSCYPIQEVETQLVESSLLPSRV